LNRIAEALTCPVRGELCKGFQLRLCGRGEKRSQILRGIMPGTAERCLNVV